MRRLGGRLTEQRRRHSRELESMRDLGDVKGFVSQMHGAPRRAKGNVRMQAGLAMFGNELEITTLNYLPVMFC